MTSFKALKAELMQNPEFRTEYEALAPEFEIARAVIYARETAGLSQRQLSEKTGITQSDINKLENGNANPTLKTLQRLAEGIGAKLTIEFQRA
ncbi:MAG: helix-turn-helix transcriptional regulator [Oscillospiraceae bacterium]|jgi:ribosome-binding protein aMBF1 (putative translation factor)|nr:helix-turn-helix transcriptional regulator [Oscillospiraceae bacterium]